MDTNSTVQLSDQVVSSSIQSSKVQLNILLEGVEKSEEGSLFLESNENENENVGNKLLTKQNLNTNLKSFNSSIVKSNQNSSEQASVIRELLAQGNLSNSGRNRFQEQISQQSIQENILKILNQSKNEQPETNQLQKLLQKTQNSNFIQEKKIPKQESYSVEDLEKELNYSITDQSQKKHAHGKRQENSFEEQQKLSVTVESQINNLEEQQILFSQIQLKMARLQSDQFQFKDAQKNYIQSLKSIRKAKGQQSKEYAKILDQMGYYYYMRQVNQLSDMCFEKSIKIKRALGDKEGLAQTLKSYGTNTRNCKRSLLMLNQSLQLSKKSYNPQRLAKIYNNIGNIHRSQCDFKEALQFYQKSIEKKQQFYGKDDPNVANTLINVGIVYYKMSCFDLGLESLKKALIIFQKDTVKNYYSIGETKTTIGLILNSKGQYEQALKIEKEALKFRQQRLGTDDIKCAYTLNHMGMIYYNLQDFQQSLKCLSNALRIHQMKKNKNLDTKYRASVLSNMGAVSIAMQNFSQADQCLSQSLKLFLNHPNPDKILHATALNNRGNYFREIDQFGRAQQYYKEGLDMLENKNLYDLIQNARFFYDIALLYRMENNLVESKQYVLKSLKIRINRCGQNHSHTLKSKSLLEEIEKSLKQIKM